MDKLKYTYLTYPACHKKLTVENMNFYELNYEIDDDDTEIYGIYMTLCRSSSEEDKLCLNIIYILIIILGYASSHGKQKYHTFYQNSRSEKDTGVGNMVSSGYPRVVTVFKFDGNRTRLAHRPWI